WWKITQYKREGIVKRRGNRQGICVNCGPFQGPARRAGDGDPRSDEEDLPKDGGHPEARRSRLGFPGLPAALYNRKSFGYEIKPKGPSHAREQPAQSGEVRATAPSDKRQKQCTRTLGLARSADPPNESCIRAVVCLRDSAEEFS